MNAALDGREQSRDAVAAGVVHVQVDGQANGLEQPIDEQRGGARAQEPGHVFDAEEMGAHVFRALRQIGVIVEAVFGALRIGDVPGVADGELGHLARLAHAIDRDLHRIEIVQ